MITYTQNKRRYEDSLSLSLSLTLSISELKVRWEKSITLDIIRIRPQTTADIYTRSTCPCQQLFDVDGEVEHTPIATSCMTQNESWE